MKTLYSFDEAKAKLHITKGNRKIGKGIWSFSTLPGNACHLLKIKGDQILTDIPGTCSKHCEACFNKGCYAVNSAQRYHNTIIKAWGENTLLLRNGKVWDLLREFLDKKNARYRKVMQKAKEDIKKEEKKSGKCLTNEQIDAIMKITKIKAESKAAVCTFRINVSGEIQDATELHHWADLARLHPEIQFGIYTKNFEALGTYLDECVPTTGNPSNFVINVSEWHGVASDFIKEYSTKYPKVFNVFEYDDSNRKYCTLSEEEQSRLKRVQHCPAVTKEGKHAKTSLGISITCDMCRRCYRSTGERTAVYSH